MIEELKRLLKECATKKIVVIGECVRDVFVNTQRLSGPSDYQYTITKQLQRREFPGGAYPVARDLSNFVSKVHFVTCSTHEFPTNLERMDVIPISRERISKTRFFSGHNSNIFHYHCVFSEEITLSLTPLQELASVFSEADLVIVLDYGHGLLNSDVRKSISQNARFVALNCQANEDKYPFHQIWKYESTDLLLLNKVEAEINLLKTGVPVQELALRLHSKFKSTYTIVTDAEHGAVIQHDYRAYSSPAMSSCVVDAVGCSDIMLGFAALAAQNGKSAEEILYFASVAAGAKTMINVHERPLSREDLYEIALGVQNET
ncbi:hypothetical protein KQ247_17300 [Ruegeria pomeroyi]|uniref:Carbohydrate kinase PfkB domain-containing protein n=1 Tax=Ruegeria pomeroyi TaxID=89184 RepID=A0A850LHW8_9RHOB|nr:hypothetical protein [Ruegeria pomeroyi]NVK97704.1 hypothetical protein [Ruegeria pomeroyi]NVL03952.1 hypothetical protein [Ruegeria pomeroyi]QWV08548.1 hypothetical protein KQ247_17300 [Ruegeria pomeroyi]